MSKSSSPAFGAALVAIAASAAVAQQGFVDEEPPALVLPDHGSFDSGQAPIQGPVDEEPPLYEEPPVPVKPDQSQSVQQTQQQGEILAEDLVGQTVYSAQTEDAESVGDIEDLVLDADGNISAVVITVGGFLGIGQKQVAVSFEELQFSQDQDGELRVVVNATQEQLEAAPEFFQGTVDDEPPPWESDD